jgi:hypothetical protein
MKVRQSTSLTADHQIVLTLQSAMCQETKHTESVGQAMIIKHNQQKCFMWIR